MSAKNYSIRSTHLKETSKNVRWPHFGTRGIMCALFKSVQSISEIILSKAMTSVGVAERKPIPYNKKFICSLSCGSMCNKIK